MGDGIRGLIRRRHRWGAAASARIRHARAICDLCGRQGGVLLGAAGGTREYALARMRDSGWLLTQVDPDGWECICPDCAAGITQDE